MRSTVGSDRQRWGRRAAWAAGLASAFACTLVACSARGETAAGVQIVNIARVTATQGGQTGETASNRDVLIVAERLDIALAASGATTPAGDGVAVPATLTNRGNGQEAFVLSASANAGAAVRGIAPDRDGNGRYDPAIDTPLSPDGATPPLAPGQALVLFMLVGGGSDGSVTLTARAATGAGTPGTTLPGRGDGGGDAVVGPTGAAATITIPYSADGQPPTLTKRQSVAAADGSDSPRRGSIVTYVIDARFPAATTDAVVDDPIPAGTAYVPGSLRLDGATLSDAAGDDAGDASAARVRVALGPVAAASAHAIQFQVSIQ